jgi:hypothetical protein
MTGEVEWTARGAEYQGFPEFGHQVSYGISLNE